MNLHGIRKLDATIFIRETAIPVGTTIKEYRCDGLYNVRFNAVGVPASVTITNPHATDPLLIGIAESYSVLQAEYVPVMKVGAGDSQEVLISPGSYFLCWASDVSSADRAIVASTNGAYVDFATTDTIINEAYNYEFDVPSGQTAGFILTFNSPTTGSVTLQLLDSTNAVVDTQVVDVTLGANEITWGNLVDPIAEGSDYVRRITPAGTGLSSLAVDLDLTGGGGGLGPQDITAGNNYVFGPFTVATYWTCPYSGTISNWLGGDSSLHFLLTPEDAGAFTGGNTAYAGNGAFTDTFNVQQQAIAGPWTGTITITAIDLDVTGLTLDLNGEATL